MKNYDLITILGPTASGKTTFACHLASTLDTEIISGDSRQVYKSMDIGTGKDLSDYIVDGKPIPYHLIDIREAGDKYNIFEYQHDFHQVYTEIKDRGKLPVLCGGSGLYIESVLKGYSLVNVPENKELRKKYADYNLPRLTEMLASYKILHNSTDVDTAQRAIRAIEIEEYKKEHPMETNEFPPLNSLVVGVDIDRELRRKKISERLKARLKEGMIEEVQAILNKGVSADDLIYYGLEYKYVTLYIQKQLTYEEMFTQLEIAIHQFAKRQMTWFRGMEKRGIHIHWIDATLPMEKKISEVMALLAE
ncbi:tRNA dimethylallyltransferase [Dysgonomonas sp. PFB1-18]|uniref:tRNA (adenosine(37)-N6)-dimethylallyltransferase MiaA n=1 Tax=unclassified Dysgonomonas TaxID=2630389 RepID=UPI0024755772|nr:MULTISPECIES: tRNA (adenosine(37)-N6)-dimethylallyltransferase MiaA [unclassified Dysgonomonas]MDH6310402.1 tRNA dimethylallyltransferase [Dysgonomonas sp. PF1-14]MDH6340268.1 tRNA dimethylallyltransferase [Dysgonomonas sp. PF1-16]MDH6381952.1 tRNA dimethylallyltransferase [Dysgonomonas sp. PFB1-18]MDH6399239.1 tRNA dimethylallyltransferase [Dysgonomonas sp. PF1-23]